MNNLNPQTYSIATGEALRPLVDTLQSMQDWALASVAYVKCHNHLTRDQKQYLEKILQQPEYQWRVMIQDYQSGKQEIQVAAIKSEIQRYLNLQAKLNKFAWYYEFPRFPLPEHIAQPFGFEHFLVDLYYDRNPNSAEAILFYGGNVRMDLVYSLSTLQANNLLFVTYRHDYKHPRQLIRPI